MPRCVRRCVSNDSQTKDEFKIVDMSVAQLRVSLAQLQDGICTVRPAEQSVSGQTRVEKYVCTVCSMTPGVQHELCEHVDCAGCDVIVQCSDNQEVPTIPRCKISQGGGGISNFRGGGNSPSEVVSEIISRGRGENMTRLPV